MEPDGEGLGLAGKGLGGTAVGLDEHLLGEFGVDGLAAGLRCGEGLPAFPGGLVEDAGAAGGVGTEDEVEAVGEGGGVRSGYLSKDGR
ncbi:MAG: hypothetical protein IPF56_00040 [Chloroflexi bacterium]|nr:hypothetical protein [Chloroflexota bacterium]